MSDKFNEMLAKVIEVFGGEIVFQPKRPEGKRCMKHIPKELVDGKKD